MTLARRVHGIDKNLEGRLVVQAGGPPRFFVRCCWGVDPKDYVAIAT
jgi:hypothetical protein